MVASKSVIMKKTLNIDTVNMLVQEMDLTTKSRLNDFLYPRSILYYHLWKESHWTYQRIANLFCKNHATVMNGIKKYIKMSQNAKQFPDFLAIKTKIELQIFDLEAEEQAKFEASLFQKVMSCNNYFEMRLLQEELKKTMEVA